MKRKRNGNFFVSATVVNRHDIDIWLPTFSFTTKPVIGHFSACNHQPLQACGKHEAFNRTVATHSKACLYYKLTINRLVAILFFHKGF